MKIKKGDYIIEVGNENSDYHFTREFIKILRVGLFGNVEYYDGLFHRSDFEEEVNITIPKKYFEHTTWLKVEDFMSSLKPQLKIYKCFNELPRYYLSIASSENFELLLNKSNNVKNLMIINKAELSKKDITIISEKEYLDVIKKEAKNDVLPYHKMKYMPDYEFAKKLVSAPEQKFFSYIRYELLKHIAPEYKDKFKQEMYQQLTPEEAQF